MLEKKLFLKSFLILAEMYNYKYTDELMEIYYRVLKVFTNEEFKKSCKYIMLNNTFFPKPKDFLEFKIKEANEKFLEILKSGLSVQCDDPYIVQTILVMGGLEDIRNVKPDKIVFLEKEFKEKYKFQLTNELKNDLPIVLYTKIDKQNIKNELPLLPRSKIGDHEKYLDWANKMKKSVVNGVKKINMMNKLKTV